MRRLILSFGILGMVLAFGRGGVWALETVSATASAEVTGVNYTLPYPGMLPDSPFYFLKTLRDKVVSFFIFDSQKKAEYFLLLSDKRLGAGKALIDGGKVSLGTSVLVEGENYFDKAVSQLEKASSQKKSTGAIIERFLRAAKKHLFVLGDLETKVPSSAKKDVESAISLSIKETERLNKLFEERIRMMER